MKTIKASKINIALLNLIIPFLLAIGITSCAKDDGPTQTETVKSSAKQITSFVFLLTNNPIDINVIATIDEQNKTITAIMPPGTILSGLLPEVKLSELASVNITTAQDFNDSIAYTVTAEDGSQTIYTVTVTALLTQRQILQVILDTNPENTLGWDLQNTSDLSDLEEVGTDVEGSITHLLLSQNNLSVFPPEIGQLTNLTFLQLGGNSITNVPIEIGNLLNLKKLLLGGNQLTSVHPEIWKLDNLIELDLSSNQISSIPAELGLLTNLEIGVLQNNNITSIPKEIENLSKLRILQLESNNLTSLPPEIGALINLSSLNISNNQLTSIPPELGLLTNLGFLILTSNQLSSLPEELGFLINLIQLRSSSNNLSTVPKAINNLELFNATLLDLGEVIFETNTQKDALISIYSANPGNTLEWGVNNFPEVTFNANGNPTVITMNNKNLSRIPSNIEKLQQLETLNANGNNIPTLPKSLININGLGVLNLDRNLLNTVPVEFRSFSNLTLLTLTNNPITNIPQEVCDVQNLTILTDPGEGCN